MALSSQGSGDKISQLIQHLWHIYETVVWKRYLLSATVKGRALHPHQMVIRTWRILHTVLCFFSYWQKLLHFWYGKAFLEDWRLNFIVEWSMFGSSFHLDLDRQLLIIWWPLNLPSWTFFELHRWLQWNKVVPTRNLSSDWSASLSLYTQHLEVKKQQLALCRIFFFLLFTSFSLVRLNRSSVG